jgi:hypothetical protein
MRAPDINFVPPRRLGRGWWMLLAAAMLVAGADQANRAWKTHRSIEAAHARVAQGLAQATRERDRGQAQAARQRAGTAYAKDALDASHEAAFALDAVLASVESVQIVGVRLVSIDIAARDGLVKAEVEATDSQALLRYVQAINAGEPVERWVLVRMQGGRTGPFAVTGSLESQWANEPKAPTFDQAGKQR